MVHDGEFRENVTVQVFKNGKILRTIAVNNRGKYQIDIPFDREYLLVYRASFMIPVSIQVNTEYTNALEKNLLVEVPVNMELFKRFETLDISAYRTPVGVVAESNEEMGMFEFYPDKQAISKIKIVNEKSILLSSQAEKPIETRDSELKQILFIQSQKEKSGLDNDGVVKNKESGPNTKEEARKEGTIDHEKEKMNATITQYQQQESGYKEAAIVMRQRQANALNSKEIRSDNQYEYIYKTKELKSRELQKIEYQKNEFVKAKVDRQEYLAGLITDGALGKSVDVERKRPLSKKNNAGFILSEEIITINEAGIPMTYRHNNYDWMFFELDYYYKGKEEITKEQYDRAKSLFE